MDINFTLIGEMITFAVLIFITLKYIWPPLTKAMEERQQKIADGLAAAERGQQTLEISQQKSKEIMSDVHKKYDAILAKAEQEKLKTIEASKLLASEESAKIMQASMITLEKEKQLAKETLQKEVGSLSMLALEKMLAEKIDEKTDAAIFAKFIEILEKPIT